KRRIRAGELDSICYTVALASGLYVLTAAGNILYFYSIRLAARTERRTGERLQRVIADAPRTVWALCDGVEVSLPLDQLRVGDTIVLQAGEFVPIDGTVVAGWASVD